MPGPEKHPIPVTTPVGDALWLRAMSGIECLGNRSGTNVAAERGRGHQARRLGGKNDHRRAARPNNQTRYFHGHVASFSQPEKRGELHHYSAVLRPWFWLLTSTSDCRIFQKMTARDIIKQVFRDRGFSDFSESLSGTYREREYCVQYRETDFNFVSRLMEEEGIYYYFKHEKSQAYPGALRFGQCSPYGARLRQDPLSSRGRTRSQARPDQRMGDHPGTSSLQVRPAGFRLPESANESGNAGAASAERRHQHKDKEVYDYPGLYAK